MSRLVVGCGWRAPHHAGAGPRMLTGVRLAAAPIGSTRRWGRAGRRLPEPAQAAPASIGRRGEHPRDLPELQRSWNAMWFTTSAAEIGPASSCTPLRARSSGSCAASHCRDDERAAWKRSSSSARRAAVAPRPRGWRPRRRWGRPRRPLRSAARCAHGTWGPRSRRGARAHRERTSRRREGPSGGARARPRAARAVRGVDPRIAIAP